MINRYSHPTLVWILDYWPATIFVPIVLLVIVVLALITRSWDKRDLERETARRSAASAAVVKVGEGATRGGSTGA